MGGVVMGGAAVGGAAANIVSSALAAPFTFGASLLTGVALAAGFDALIRSYFRAEEEKKFRLSEVQVAIEKDRKVCIRLQELLDSLNRTFSSTTSAGATSGAMVRNVSDSLKRTSSFADPSDLPRDITQLVKSSLDRLPGSTSPIVEEIRGILNKLKCPNEAEIKRLVPKRLAKGETLDWQTIARVLEDSFDNGAENSTLPREPAN